MFRHINDKDGMAPNKCWNLGPQLPGYATWWDMVAPWLS